MTKSQVTLLQRSRPVVITVFMAACLLLLGGAFFALQIPDVSSQLPPDTTPIIIDLKSPANGQQVGITSLTTVEALALGAQPITSMELWADGVLVAAIPASLRSNSNQYSAFWAWTADTPGPHTLLVRAVDANGQTATSNAIQVAATDEADAAFQISYQPDAGDTLDSIALEFELSPEEILYLNPQITATTLLDSSQVLNIPIKFPEFNIEPIDPAIPAQPPSDPGQAAGPAMNPLFFWVNKNFSPAERVLPAAPNLYVNTADCSAKISISAQSENEDGFFLYRLAPNGSIFKRIQTFGPANGAAHIIHEDPDLYGSFQYYVSAFNTAGESQSNLVSVNIDDAACQTSEWSSLRLENPMFVTSLPVDKFYCYVAANGGPWSRIPFSPDAYFIPQNGQFDLSRHLNTVSPNQSSSMEMECWGWQGEGLTYLGTGKQVYEYDPQTASEVQLNGDHFQVTGQLVSRAERPSFKTLPSPVIPPPANFHTTQDPAECGTHSGIPLFGAVICAALIDQHQELVFVWDWPGALCPQGEDCGYVSSVDGYRVYGFGSITNGTEYLVDMATVTGQNKTTAGFPYDQFFSHPDSFDEVNFPICYYVTAFVDGNESKPSETICPDMPQDAGLFPTTTPVPPTTPLLEIDADNLSVWIGSSVDKYGNTLCPAPHTVKSSGQSSPIDGSGLIMGYKHAYVELPCEIKKSTYIRGQIGDFSLVPLKDKQVLSATLKYDWIFSIRKHKDIGINFGDPVQTYKNDTSCAANLLLFDIAAGDEWHGILLQPISSDPIAITSLDVTSVVAQYAQQNLILRFIITSAGEAPVEDNWTCWSGYRNFRLFIKYQ